jgi:hypothetical protein
MQDPTYHRNDGVPQLSIYSHFRTDYNLPKHRSDDGPQQSGNIFMSDNGITRAVDNNMSEPPTMLRAGKSWLKRLRKTLTRKVVRPLRDRAKMTPDQALYEAHVMMQQLEDTAAEPMKQRLKEFDAHVAQAKQMGQEGLHERLVFLRQRAVAELALAQAGVAVKYLTEVQAATLIDTCKEGLTLDWISDFGRSVPADVFQKKQEADKLKVFDNYVVMHFDPQRKNFTPPRDPILFGVLRASRRLYFVADWTDDVCKFTMEEAERLLDGKSEKPGVTGQDLEA